MGPCDGRRELAICDFISTRSVLAAKVVWMMQPLCPHVAPDRGEGAMFEFVPARGHGYIMPTVPGLPMRSLGQMINGNPTPATGGNPLACKGGKSSRYFCIGAQ